MNEELRSDGFVHEYLLVGQLSSLQVHPTEVSSSLTLGTDQSFSWLAANLGTGLGLLDR